MMQEQVEKVRAETKAVRESMERAREVVDRIGNGQSDVDQVKIASEREVPRDKIKKSRESANKRMWEILENEVGKV